MRECSELQIDCLSFRLRRKWVSICSAKWSVKISNLILALAFLAPPFLAMQKGGNLNLIFRINFQIKPLFFSYVVAMLLKLEFGRSCAADHRQNQHFRSEQNEAPRRENPKKKSKSALQQQYRNLDFLFFSSRKRTKISFKTNHFKFTIIKFNS